jgi:hypothetical protein
MRKQFILLWTFLALTTSVFAGKTPQLIIEYGFKGIEEGYDHIAKAYIYIDGTKVMETPEHKQSQDQSFTLKLTPGKHQVRVELWALYEDEWELHTVDNNYSIDCIVEDEFNIKKKGTLKIVFDLDKDTSYSFKGK